MNQRTKDFVSQRVIPWTIIGAVLAAFLLATNGACGAAVARAQVSSPAAPATPAAPQAPAAPANPQAQAIVARAMVLAPAPVVRFTIPVAQAARMRPPAGADASPWTVVRSDGATLRTQFEVVARWPSGAVRIAEVLAADPFASAPAQYVVADVPALGGRPAPGPWAKAWTLAAPVVHFDGDARSLTWSSTWHRSGPVAVTRRAFGRNCVAWVTAWHGVDAVDVTLLVHNGHPGSPDLFFDALELELPGAPVAAVVAAQAAPAGHELQVTPAGRVSLVRPRSDGFAHALVQRGAHAWRFAVCGADAAGTTPSPAGLRDARALAAFAGWGTVDAWEHVDAYAAAALRLPDLEYRAAALAGDQRAEWATFNAALGAGAPVGIAAGPGRLDWQHAFNPKYGGVTGGGFRRQWHGVDAVATAEPATVRLYAARLGTIMDRQAVAIVEPNGMPVNLAAYCDAAGTPRGWASSATDAPWDGKTDGPFGFAAVQGVTAPAGRTPPELAQFKQPIAGAGTSGAYAPIDFQHWDRALCDAEALVQLANDPLAAWWLRMNAETWRMSLLSKGRLAGALAQAKQRPAWGSPWGRAHGHGLRFASMAYAIGDSGWRKAWGDSFLEPAGELLATAQTPSGFFHRDDGSKNLAGPPFNGAFSLSKGTEEALLANGALGLARSAGVRPQQLTEAVDRWASEALWMYLWGGGSTGGAPTDYVAIANLGGPPFALSAAAGVARRNADREEIASPLGSAILLRKASGLPAGLAQVLAAQRWCGGSANPLGWLQAQTAYKLLLDDCAPLHAALQLP